MSGNDRWDATRRLVSASAGWLSSHHHFEASLPGPYDDAEMELKDEMLLDAARAYVAAHAGVRTITGGSE